VVIKHVSVILVLVAASFLIGCNGPLPEKTTESPPQHPPIQNPHGEPGAEVPEALIRLRDSTLEAKAKYEKAPKDAVVAQAYSKALTELGDAIQNAPDLSRSTKFRQALQMFRKAVELDPKNERAAALIQQSEAIYEQMGRPVPEREEPDFEL
jgi:tetratricopeptide (TPR) repeat protein